MTIRWRTPLLKNNLHAEDDRPLAPGNAELLKAERIVLPNQGVAADSPLHQLNIDSVCQRGARLGVDLLRRFSKAACRLRARLSICADDGASLLWSR
jgi:hypothetical protein